MEDNGILSVLQLGGLRALSVVSKGSATLQWGGLCRAGPRGWLCHL